MQISEPSNFVVKSNSMNQMTAYKQRSPLSESEQMVALAIISKISPNDTDFQQYELTPSELSELTGIRAEHLSGKRMDGICLNLITTAFTIKTEKSVIHVPFFIKAERLIGSGSIFFQFSPELKPHLLELKGNFTKYRLNVLSMISGAYSKRIYELLVQWKTYKKPWELELNEFKEMLFIDKKKHQRFNNFRRILDQAHKEISGKSDIDFDWKPITKGRKVIALQFLVRVKEKKKTLTTDKVASVSQCRDLPMLTHLQSAVPTLPENQAVLLVNSYSREVLTESLFALLAAMSTGQIKTTPAQYLMGVLKNKKYETIDNPSDRKQKTTLEKLTDRSWDDESFDFEVS